MANRSKKVNCSTLQLQHEGSAAVSGRQTEPCDIADLVESDVGAANARRRAERSAI